MGQYWKILDIDRRERLPNKNGLKLWEIVHNDTAQQLVHFLARPTFLQCSELLDQESADKTRSATTSTGPAGSIGHFAKLPSELFIVLGGFLTDVDAILLGLTCRTMWLKTCARVQEALVADAAPWSGHRIITLGDYADAHPPNMLTGAEETELRWISGGDNEGNGDAEDRNLAQGALYHHANEYYVEAKRNLLYMTVESLLDLTDATLLRALLGSLYEFVDDEDGYVLRNLSKHEYVRGNAIVELYGGKDKIPQPFIEHVGFGELIALRTQWTDDPSGTMGSEEGCWAGDRFDIVLTKTLEKKGRGGAWTDVSEDAVSMLNETIGDKLEEYR